jgi:hypothetical protein
MDYLNSCFDAIKKSKERVIVKVVRGLFHYIVFLIVSYFIYRNIDEI